MNEELVLKVRDMLYDKVTLFSSMKSPESTIMWCAYFNAATMLDKAINNDPDGLKQFEDK